MRKAITIILLTFSLLVNAQLSFSVEGTGSHSLISKSAASSTSEIPYPYKEHKSYRTATYKADYTNRLGAGLTVGLNYFFQENLSLETGINFKNINFSQKTSSSYEAYYLPMKEGVLYPELPKLPDTETKDNFNLLLLSVPISASYYLLDNKLSASLGILPGYLLYSKGGSGASSEFNKFQMGIQVQLRYQFAPKIWIVAGFQEYSTKLYKPELKQSFSNLREVQLGLRYDI